MYRLTRVVVVHVIIIEEKPASNYFRAVRVLREILFSVGSRYPTRTFCVRYCYEFRSGDPFSSITSYPKKKPTTVFIVLLD